MGPLQPGNVWGTLNFILTNPRLSAGSTDLIKASLNRFESNNRPSKQHEKEMIMSNDIFHGELKKSSNRLKPECLDPVLESCMEAVIWSCDQQLCANTNILFHFPY